MTELPTLDEFIAEAYPRLAAHRIASRSHVREPGFEKLYVRMTKHAVHGELQWPVLDLADITVEPSLRGKGHFTRLLRTLKTNHPRLHLYVENTFEPRFAAHLARIGFITIDPGGGPPSHFLASTQELRDAR